MSIIEIMMLDRCTKNHMKACIKRDKIRSYAELMRVKFRRCK